MRNTPFILAGLIGVSDSDMYGGSADQKCYFVRNPLICHEASGIHIERCILFIGVFFCLFFCFFVVTLFAMIPTPVSYSAHS